jgi:hypothetical protein
MTKRSPSHLVGTRLPQAVGRPTGGFESRPATMRGTLQWRTIRFRNVDELVGFLYAVVLLKPDHKTAVLYDRGLARCLEDVLVLDVYDISQSLPADYDIALLYFDEYNRWPQWLNANVKYVVMPISRWDEGTSALLWRCTILIV